MRPREGEAFFSSAMMLSPSRVSAAAKTRTGGATAARAPSPAAPVLQSGVRPMNSDAKSRFIDILQQAYSGERAAAYAYRGHWRSLHDSDDRSRLQTIEEGAGDPGRRGG